MSRALDMLAGVRACRMGTQIPGSWQAPRLSWRRPKDPQGVVAPPEGPPASPVVDKATRSFLEAPKDSPRGSR